MTYTPRISGSRTVSRTLPKISPRISQQAAKLASRIAHPSAAQESNRFQSLSSERATSDSTDGDCTPPPHQVNDTIPGVHAVPRRSGILHSAAARVEVRAKHLRHFSPLVRSWAGRRLGEQGDAANHDALIEAAARVR